MDGKGLVSKICKQILSPPKPYEKIQGILFPTFCLHIKLHKHSIVCFSISLGVLFSSVLFDCVYLCSYVTDLREPRQIQSPSLSPITHGSLSSSSSPSSLSPLASSRNHSVFHSELKTWLFSKSFPPQTFSFLTRLILLTLGPFNIFILLNGWICLYGVLD